MKTLLIMRHAKSSWTNSGMSDYKRPLNSRGKENAPKMGQLLRDNDMVPDLIMASSANRAQTTAELVAMACGYENGIEYTRRFYLAEPDAYIEALQALEEGPDCVMVVGHNPGLEYLIEILADEDEVMQTAVIAHLQLPINHWSELTADINGKLINIWRPREL